MTHKEAPLHSNCHGLYISSTSRVVISSKVVACSSQPATFNGHPSTLGHLTGLRNKPQLNQTCQHLAAVYWQLVYWWSYPLMGKTVLWHGVCKWRVLAKQVTFGKLLKWKTVYTPLNNGTIITTFFYIQYIELTIASIMIIELSIYLPTFWSIMIISYSSSNGNNRYRKSWVYKACSSSCTYKQSQLFATHLCVHVAT